MTTSFRSGWPRFRLSTGFVAIGAIGAIGLVGCGSDQHNIASPESVNTDYSAIEVAAPSDAALVHPASEQTLGDLLKNGLRLSLSNRNSTGLFAPIGAAAPMASSAPGVFSGTTVQVDGVDEGDSVKYDGRHLFILQSKYVSYAGPPVPQGPAAGLTIAPIALESTLIIQRTDATTATAMPVAEYRIPGRQAMAPVLYRVAGAGGATQYIASVHQANWSVFAADAPNIIQSAAIVRPNRVVVNLLAVSDPSNVSRAWKVEVEGWLRTTRQVDDTLFVVSSHWPTIVALDYQAQTEAQKAANERLIRNTAVSELLPHTWNEMGIESPLVDARGCLLPAGVGVLDAYRELLVVTAIDLRRRRIADVECLSAGDNGIYMSQESLFVGGTRQALNTSERPGTILHKLELADGNLEYAASGRVEGVLPWNNSSYFMDEHAGDLRIVTTRYSGIANSITHHLAVLRNVGGGKLAVIGSLPNAVRPAPIGKPGEQIQAVRFAGERGYIVTFRRIDPLYVLDLKTPEDPAIAGELEVPGFSTYLRALDKDYLLGVGQNADTNGNLQGVKVELFDVSDLQAPQSVGSQIFGRSWTPALFDPHALTFLTLPGADPRFRMAMSLSVFDHPTSHPQIFSWSYTGLHLFEISGLQTGMPRLHFQGVLEAENSSSPNRIHADPVRSVLHDDAVFYVYGSRVIASLWDDVD